VLLLKVADAAFRSFRRFILRSAWSRNIFYPDFFLFPSLFRCTVQVIGGNHDLEGIDEFPTDETNLEAYLSILGKPTPYFKRLLADKVRRVILLLACRSVALLGSCILLIPTEFHHTKWQFIAHHVVLSILHRHHINETSRCCCWAWAPPCFGRRGTRRTR
jgi:hypothetical protein